MLVVGCIVGVGIFRTASTIATHLPSPALILGLWAVGGLISLCGALCYAELAALFPATGGDYVFITKVYGRFWGFLFGWAKLFVERTGTIAILGYVFAEYARTVVPFDAAMLRWVAAEAVLLLTAVNVVGVRWGTAVQNLFTALKILALGSLILVGWQAWSIRLQVADWTVPPIDFSVLQSMGVAFTFVLWTYGGWTEAAYVAGEVRRPTRNVPRAIVGGLALTAVLYLLVNWSYLTVVPIDELADTPLVAARVANTAWGPAGGVFIAWMIACSAFGALNGYILTGGRILYAMGRDHPMFVRLGTVHPDFRTPTRALWANAAMAIGLIFTKTFDQIMTYSTVVISVFFIMAVFSVVLLRRARRPSTRARDAALSYVEGRRRAPRRALAWGYPVTPLVFCLTLAGFILNICVKEPYEAAFGFVLLAIGVPLYALSHRSHRSR